MLLCHWVYCPLSILNRLHEPTSNSIHTRIREAKPFRAHCWFSVISIRFPFIFALSISQRQSWSFENPAPRIGPIDQVEYCHLFSGYALLPCHSAQRLTTAHHVSHANDPKYPGGRNQGMVQADDVSPRPSNSKRG